MNNVKKYFVLNNCNALIAGGATGLGYEMAEGLLSVGCDVTIIGRTEERINSSANLLNDKYNSTCIGMTCDISDENSFLNVINHFASVNGDKLNIAINSAGFNIRNKIEDITLDEWESIQKVNLTGGFIFAKGVYPLLKNADFGRLINITSIFSKVSFPERASYSSSKGGLLQLTKTLAVEWADSKITVNCISPGPFLTDINKPVLDNPENYKASNNTNYA